MCGLPSEIGPRFVGIAFAAHDLRWPIKLTVRFNEILPVESQFQKCRCHEILQAVAFSGRDDEIIRDRMLEHLQSRGIGAGIHYPIPVHRQPAYLKQGYGEVRLPITEQVASEIISLPMYPELSRDQIEYVAEAVNEVI